MEVLYFSDRAVKQKLFSAVTSAKKLTLVTVLPPHQAVEHPELREPFASLEREFGSSLQQVLVVDEGKIEGMWRDPVVDLADALFPSDAKSAYAAARGYLLIRDGAPAATVRKSQDPDADLQRLENAIERLSLKRAHARPEPSRRPSARRSEAARTVPDEPSAAEEDTQEAGGAWEVLGLKPGASLTEAKQAWKQLLVQYHPDKVAHLAPEFQRLAEEKTRQIMDAWAVIQATYEKR